MEIERPARTPADSKFALPRTARLVEVTPEMAADWLDTRNTPEKNRSISKVISGRYADAMRRSEWKETHQGLAFDTEGWLLDGQHRLLAVANSGVVVSIWVFPDMPRDTFDVLDVGRRRVASQLLHVPNSTVLTSAVRFLAVADGIKEPRSANVGYAELSNVETLDLVRKGGYKLEQAARVASRMRSGARTVPSPTAAVIYQALATEHSGQLEEFVEGIVTGANLDKNDPRLRLRNAFNTSAARRAAAVVTPTMPYALVAKSWNAFVMHREINQLQWRMDEELPRVIGYTPTLHD